VTRPRLFRRGAGMGIGAASGAATCEEGMLILVMWRRVRSLVVEFWV
jgi:hypothetical protein